MKHPVLFILLFFFCSGSFSQSFYTYYNNGLKQERKKNWEEAVECFEKALELDDQEGEQKRTYGMNFIDYYPLRELGITHFELGNYKQAEKYLTKSDSLSPSKRAALYLEKIKMLQSTAPPPVQLVEKEEKKVEPKPVEQPKPIVPPKPVEPEKPKEPEAVVPEIIWKYPLETNLTIDISEFPLRAEIISNVKLIDYKILLNNAPLPRERGFIPLEEIQEEPVQSTSGTLQQKSESGKINHYPIKCNLKLKEGQNHLLITAFNKAGQTVSTPVTINFLPPVVLETRIALIIGNGAYEHINQLKNPTNDACSISRALKNFGFEVICITNANQKTMKKAIDDFGEKLRQYEVALFFYAGHAIQVNGQNYLVPVDANLKTPNDAEYDCINPGRVMGKMEAAQNKTNIVILDACRNNPFALSWNRSSSLQGLAFMDAPAGSIIAYSTSPGKTAADGTGNNGLYTEVLIDELKQKKVPLLDLFRNVRVKVMEKSNNAQIPWESNSLSDEFYFNP